MQHTWTCRCCGQSFDTLPMEYAVPAPRNWFAIAEAERATRAQLTSDLCIIDGTERYVRGCLEVPVLDSPEHLEFGVWVSISEQSLDRILELWDAPDLDDEPPRFGWLATWLRGYPEPHEIRCHVHLRSGGLRPRIVLQPTSYPLSVEQHDGITLGRVQEIAAQSGHPH